MRGFIIAFVRQQKIIHAWYQNINHEKYIKLETGMTLKSVKISFPERMFSVESIRGVPLAFPLSPTYKEAIYKYSTFIYYIYITFI